MILTFIISILIFNFLLEFTLEFINGKRWSNKLPAELTGIYDTDKYKLSQEYDRVKKRFSLFTSAVNLCLMLLFILSGSFALLDKWALNKGHNEISASLIFFGVLFILSDLIGLPFSMYRIFVIEDRFGFNRTTLKIFFTDKIKGYLLGSILGGSLLTIFVLFYQHAGPYFWVYAWLSLALIMFFTTMLYASWILPLFNKLSPLPEGPLRTSIETYCRTVNFKLDDLFIMDGSKRSSKANAFFSGIGKRKRIVLYDTLVNNHTNEELVSILAHEIGHYKKKHTRTSFVLSLLQAGLMFFIFSRLIGSPSLSTAFGSTVASLRLGILGFGLLYNPISLLMGLLMNIVSRKNEFEADRFAAKTSNGQALQESLKKLSVNNLSNLQPHPLYVFFYYSHPPLLQRLRALRVIS
jgi:STE24 endopeptidase